MLKDMVVVYGVLICWIWSGMTVYCNDTTFLFGEKFTMKILIQLLLCFTIILVQTFWKDPS